MNPYTQHPENPQITKAFLLLRKGKHTEAVEIIREQGYPDAEHQADLIEQFILYMAATIIKKERKAKAAVWTPKKFKRATSKPTNKNKSTTPNPFQ